MGERRTWKALVPIIAPARFSLTYAFIPWITATTTTRNADGDDDAEEREERAELGAPDGLEREPESL